jgi:hypothetical protein
LEREKIKTKLAAGNMSLTTETREQIRAKALESEERQTIVHCSISNADDNYAYRIWPSTFLIEQGTGRRAKLITAFNISFAPEWTMNDGKGFTLIFEGLSKGCMLFDLKEVIPQEGGFEVLGIPRNRSDVYTVEF